MNQKKNKLDLRATQQRSKSHLYLYKWVVLALRKQKRTIQTLSETNTLCSGQLIDLVMTTRPESNVCFVDAPFCPPRTHQISQFRPTTFTKPIRVCCFIIQFCDEIVAL